jgi:3-phenylpropionate/trans-cinnamate dioxygenase ferredoxin reductase subunit
MHYLIVGNGVAGITAAFALRQREPKAEITVVSGESDYFYSRTALMYAYMDRMNLRDLEPHERRVYDVQKIRRVRAWVTDIDASAHTVGLDSGQSMQYDRLLLATGSVPRMPVWQGLDGVREGVVHFVSLQHLAECERLTPSTKHAVVVGGGLIGMELVECLRHHGVSVTFLVRERWYWPVALGAEEGAMVEAHMRRHGVDVRLEEEVAEVQVDGSGRVSGVRTNRGQQVDAQMLGICIGVRPAIDFLRNVATPPALDRGIVVSPGFRTSLPDVYSAGDCAQVGDLVEQIWYSAKRQGELAARAMLGDAVNYVPPTFYNSAKFFDIEYTTVGDLLHLPPGTREYFRRLPNREVTVRLLESEGVFLGGNLLGSRWDHTFFERWIAERRSLDYVLARLPEAQFDVEFGRVNLEVR